MRVFRRERILDVENRVPVIRKVNQLPGPEGVAQDDEAAAVEEDDGLLDRHAGLG